MTAPSILPPPAPTVAWVIVGRPGHERPARVEGTWQGEVFVFAWGGFEGRRGSAEVWFTETLAWRALEQLADEARTAAAHAYHAADANAQRVRRGLLEAQRRWLRGRHG